MFVAREESPEVGRTQSDDPNYKGNVAEAEIAAAAARAGIPVLRPAAEHTRYDMVFELPSGFKRIQCKWARRREAVVVVELTSSRYTKNGSIRTTYSRSEIDAVVAYCADLDRCYYLPIEDVAGHRAIQLRLRPPRNGQRACINLAEAFEFPGAIAQLGERCRGTAEAVGSSPTGSTTSFDGSPLGEIGAHEFRNRFGYYMELAEAGQDITCLLYTSPSPRDRS